MKNLIALLCLLLPLTATASNLEGFSKGPVFKNYGENISIEGGLDSAATQHFKVVFDIAEQTGEGELNRSFNSVARFINMHVRAGVPLANIEVAMVVHGKASLDLLRASAYQDRFAKTNLNEELLNALLRSGVEIYLCGQSAAFAGIGREELNQGVKMSLSAMTANALLQQRGFTLNPF